MAEFESFIFFWSCRSVQCCLITVRVRVRVCQRVCVWTFSIEVKLVSFSAVTHSAVAASAVLVPPPVSLHVYFEVFDQAIYVQSAAISVVVSIRAFQSLDLRRKIRTQWEEKVDEGDQDDQGDQYDTETERQDCAG